MISSEPLADTEDSDTINSSTAAALRVFKTVHIRAEERQVAKLKDLRSSNTQISGNSQDHDMQSPQRPSVPASRTRQRITRRRCDNWRSTMTLPELRKAAFVVLDADPRTSSSWKAWSWFCGGCGDGPMNIHLCIRCRSCGRIGNGYSHLMTDTEQILKPQGRFDWASILD